MREFDISMKNLKGSRFWKGFTIVAQAASQLRFDVVLNETQNGKGKERRREAG